MPLNLLSLFKTSADPAKVDAAAFHESLNILTESIIALRDDVNKWKGDTFSAPFIVNKAYIVINDIRSCIKAMEALEKWTDEEEDKSFRIITNLVDLMEETSRATMNARPKFRKIYLIGDPIVLAIAHKQRDAAADLIDILKSQAREDRAGDAGALEKRANESFSCTIAAFDSKAEGTGAFGRPDGHEEKETPPVVG